MRRRNTHVTRACEQLHRRFAPRLADVTNVGWRSAMAGALYGTGGFFTRSAEGPADHFRTSVHASPLFAGALLRLIRRVDAALGGPDRLDVVDVGAGRGELLAALHALVTAGAAAGDARPGAEG